MDCAKDSTSVRSVTDDVPDAQSQYGKRTRRAHMRPRARSPAHLRCPGALAPSAPVSGWHGGPGDEDSALLDGSAAVGRTAIQERVTSSNPQLRPVDATWLEAPRQTVGMDVVAHVAGDGVIVAGCDGVALSDAAGKRRGRQLHARALRYARGGRETWPEHACQAVDHRPRRVARQLEI